MNFLRAIALVLVPAFPAATAPAQGTAPQTPPTPPAPPPQAAPAPDKVPWFAGTLESALGEAKTKGKHTLVFYRAEQNEPSASMSRVTFSDDRVVAALANVVCVRVDVASMTPLASRVPLKAVPVLVWFGPDGAPRDRLDGAVDPEKFLATHARVLSDIGTIGDLKRKFPERKDELDARFELYQRLRSVGDLQGANEHKEAILRLDPQGTSRARMRFRYEEITTAIEQHWAAKRELPMPKVEELRLFVEMQDDPEILWDGWMRLANTHAYLEQQSAQDPEAAKRHRATRRDCLARAWRAIPQERELVHRWSYDCADLFWNQRLELSDADKAFYDALTLRMVQQGDQEPGAFEFRARALMLLGRRDDALAAARKAAELAPGNARFQALLQDLQSR